MRIAIVHHYWNRPGGGQLVCASASKTFLDLGHEVFLYSTSKFYKEKYLEWFGLDLRKAKHTSLLPLELRAFGIYARLLIPELINRAVREGAKLIWTDESTYGNLRLRDVKLIEYAHFPFEVALREEFKGTGLYYGEDPYFREKYQKFPMNAYFALFVKLVKKRIRRNPFEFADLVLTNSDWTAELCERVYGQRPKVLNPPIPPNVEINERVRSHEERRNIVIALGRFSEEKRYHWILREVFPKVRKVFRDLELIVFGGARTPASLRYLYQLELLARKLGLRVSKSLRGRADVYLVPDAPRDLINETMDLSKAFLHATINEHWGIAVAEAMARGLPVVVHKSGGAWTDLALRGEVGLGYECSEEASELLIKLLSDGKAWREFSEKSMRRAEELTMDKYSEKLVEFLREVKAI